MKVKGRKKKHQKLLFQTTFLLKYLRVVLSELAWVWFLVILDHWQNPGPVHHDPWANAIADLSVLTPVTAL